MSSPVEELAKDIPAEFLVRYRKNYQAGVAPLVTMLSSFEAAGKSRSFSVQEMKEMRELFEMLSFGADVFWQKAKDFEDALFAHQTPPSPPPA